jgi:DNA (cytosine-5)-methyltransferase 1
MKYASVCSGVEAASLAWMPLGWEPVWFSEIEPFPCEVLAQRFPGVPNLGDMTKIEGEKYRGTVELLVGGGNAVFRGRNDGAYTVRIQAD